VSEPYPGFNPSFSAVEQVCGMRRTCLVIDLQSDGELGPTQLQQLVLRLEAALGQFGGENDQLRQAAVVTRDRFDPVLCKGLRLSYH